MARNVLLDGPSDEEPQPDKRRIARRLDDWKERVFQLFDDVERWLTPIRGVSIRRRSLKPPAEELTKRYGLRQPELQTVDIDFGERRAVLRPVGLWIIGANGRIDLTVDGRLLVIFDTAEPLAPSQWQVAEPAAGADSQPLTKESFLRALNLTDAALQ